MDISLKRTEIFYTGVHSKELQYISFLLPGLISVEPANGTEFETKFTLKAEENGGWYDPDADDVTFEAGVVNANGKEVPSGERQSSKEFQNIQLKQGTVKSL